MFICPNCKISLKKVSSSNGVFWLCLSCDGRSATLALLRKNIPAPVVNQLWLTAKSGKYPRKRSCPACYKMMAEVPVQIEDGKQFLDVCTVCQFIWFDRNEYADMPKIPEAPKLAKEFENIPQEARLKMALWKIEQIKEQDRINHLNAITPEEDWHWIPGFLGMPVEVENKGSKSIPIITWAISAITILISVYAFFDLKRYVDHFGFIPSRFERYGGLTFLTSFFFHADIFHLLGNMYFFFIFGDNVEDWLGRKRYLILLISATILGNIIHLLGQPNSAIPCIGASGGISGVLTFYALKFPHARLDIIFYGRWLHFPAMVLFFIWIGIQFLGVFSQLTGHSNVSALAHLGGVTVGVGFWFVTRKE